jgi:ATP-dependent Clp protease adaptor protein ClpS
VAPNADGTSETGYRDIRRLRKVSSDAIGNAWYSVPSCEINLVKLTLPGGAEPQVHVATITMSSKNGSNEDGEGKTGLVTKTRPKTKKPSLYKVLLLNDDYTPMEFVVHVLERFFNKGREEATRIMLHVHHKGVGICGVYTYEVAETKVTQVMDFCRQHHHPLQCTMEKE